MATKWPDEVENMGLEKEKTLAENLSEELKSKENNISGAASEFGERALDVFISYSSLNKNVADAVVSNFEQHGIRCWYAPRDIMPGQEWVTAIHEAINACKLFVLIYTDSSNESKQVANEVALAFNSGKTLIPFRLSDAEMSTELEYYLTRVHWLDAVKPPLMQSIESLRVYSEKILKGEELKEAKIKNATNSGKKAMQMPVWVIAIVIVLALGLLTVAIILLVKEVNSGKTPDNHSIVTDAGDPGNGNNPANSSTDSNDNNHTSVDDNDQQGGKTEEEHTAEYFFKKAYDIQMNDSAENKYELAYEEYMKTSESDTTTPEIAEAMAELAGRYSREDGVPLDYEKAIKLYDKAILSGSSSALNSMGLLYQNGDGVDQDAKKALEYYEKAAGLGEVNAMLNAGTIYQYGAENVEVDVEKALEYYKMAADKGDASAVSKYDALIASQAYNLAYYYDSDPTNSDPEKAFNYALKGAEAGSTECMIMVGDFYWYGKGTEQDYNKVLEWFGKALDSGIEGYQHNHCISLLETLVEEGHIPSESAAKWIDID